MEDTQKGFPAKSPDGTRPQGSSPSMNRAVLDIRPSGIRQVAARAAETPGCISLTLGEPAFDTPAPIREAAKRALDQGKTHYPPNAGLLSVREMIAAEEGGRYGASWTADNILVTCGSTEALACALLSILEPGDEVIVPVPAFGLYAQQVQLARGAFIPCPTAEDAFQLHAGRLASCITPRTKAILINSPNNPTGVQYTQASIDAAVALCNEHNLFLIYDAVYDRISYQMPVPKPSPAALGDRLIVCNAFSKPYAMTGWRVGYCIGGAALIRQAAKVHAALNVGVSTFSQAACEGIFDLPTDGVVQAYRAARDLGYGKLIRMGMQVVQPQGAFYLFPAIAAYGLDDDTFVSRLIDEKGVAVVPGNCFDAPGYVRISYCGDMALLSEGLNRLEAFVKAL